MTQFKALSALGLILALGACQQQPPAADNAVEVLPERTAPAASQVEPSALPRSNDDTVAAPAPAPPLTAPADRSITGARAVLLDFARAIGLKRFDQAYALLSPGDRQRWSRADFAAIFKDLGKLSVAIPTGTTDGAAGSLYYTAPITITSADQDGRPVRIEGEAVLRRVNDVDGATPAQLRWHFDHVTLGWTH